MATASDLLQYCQDGEILTTAGFDEPFILAQVKTYNAVGADAPVAEVTMWFLESGATCVVDVRGEDEFAPHGRIEDVT